MKITRITKDGPKCGAKLHHLNSIVLDGTDYLGRYREHSGAALSPSIDKHCDNFLVFSQGCMGSAWLSANLHLHPQIACTNGWWAGLEEDHIDGTKFAERGLRGDEMSQKYRNNNVSKNLKLIGKKYPDALYVGDVHGFTIKQYLSNLGASGLHNRIHLAHLIRHPVTFYERLVQQRIWGCKRHGEEFMQPILHEAHNLHQSLGLKRIYEFDSSNLRMVNFLSFMKILLDYAEEISLSRNIKLIYFEKLLSDPHYFTETVAYLTSPQIEIKQEYINAVFSVESLSNRGRIIGSNCDHSASPLDVFHGWTEVEQTLFQLFFNKLNLSEQFSHCEYDLSFIN